MSMDNTKRLLEQIWKHEKLKAKGMRLVEQDIMERIWILDALVDISIELESEYEESKDQLENIMDTDHTLLKEKEGWSDKVIGAKVKSKYTDERVQLAKMRKYAKLAKEKQRPIEHYINESKRIVK